MAQISTKLAQKVTMPFLLQSDHQNSSKRRSIFVEHLMEEFVTKTFKKYPNLVTLLTNDIFVKNKRSQTSFCIFRLYYKKTLQFMQQNNVKNVHSKFGTGI